MIFFFRAWVLKICYEYFSITSVPYSKCRFPDPTPICRIRISRSMALESASKQDPEVTLRHNPLRRAAANVKANPAFSFPLALLTKSHPIKFLPIWHYVMHSVFLLPGVSFEVPFILSDTLFSSLAYLSLPFLSLMVLPTPTRGFLSSSLGTALGKWKRINLLQKINPQRTRNSKGFCSRFRNGRNVTKNVVFSYCNIWQKLLKGVWWHSGLYSQIIL